MLQSLTKWLDEYISGLFSHDFARATASLQCAAIAIWQIERCNCAFLRFVSLTAVFVDILKRISSFASQIRRPLLCKGCGRRTRVSDLVAADGNKAY